MSRPPLPSACDLTRPQYTGHACVWCSTTLQSGAVSQGRATGRVGAHIMDVEVYACPRCADTPKTPGRNVGACDGRAADPYTP